jgi:hypothetical protein
VTAQKMVQTFFGSKITQRKANKLKIKVPFIARLSKIAILEILVI